MLINIYLIVRCHNQDLPSRGHVKIRVVQKAPADSFLSEFGRICWLRTAHVSPLRTVLRHFSHIVTRSVGNIGSIFDSILLSLNKNIAILACILTISNCMNGADGHNRPTDHFTDIRPNVYFGITCWTEYLLCNALDPAVMRPFGGL